ncbi:hypothetical protein H0248_15190 [Pectobacterium brasiliense]|uniref:hypothetical protein n=1 Tax=Pectobacterium brasiliense TaxID=180957 RepID=UPI0015DE8BA2|nr:hypothetical protein [Pectobacterium brasiliense]MBA0218685.1 hypothetical protein [Pectobacterium brasiliense]
MTNKPISEVIKKIKSAAGKATPGQWSAFCKTHRKGGTFALHTPDDERCGNIINWQGFDGNEQPKYRNAANVKYMALANPENVVRLIEYIAALEKLLAAASQKARNFEKVAHGLNSENDTLKQQLAAERVVKLPPNVPEKELEAKFARLAPQPTDRIVPVLPVRDEYGFWQHPNRIETPFDEGGASTRIYEAWFAERGMAVDFTYMNQVFCDDCLYGENIERPALHWNPESPYGDGWILTAIFETEEGPCAEWVRYKSSDSNKEAG